MAQIVDVYGRPIDTGLLTEPQTASLGWIRREFEEHPARGLTPARLQQIMTRAEHGHLIEQLDLADDIEERDGHAFSQLALRKGAIAALDWSLTEPDGASAEEKAWCEQLGEWMEAIPDFEDVLFGMMDGVLKGFSMHEIEWPLVDGVRLPRLTFRPQRWFTLSGDRERLLLRSQTMQEQAGTLADGIPPVMGEELRPLGWLQHVPRSRNGYLARTSLVRVLAWPYLFKNYSVRDLAEFLEIYGLPLRLGTYPAGASDQEKRTLLRAVAEIGHNAAGIIPAGMSVEFQNAAQGTQVPFEAMIHYMDGVESKVILGQTLSSSEGQHGTQALGKVHEQVRMDIRASDARQIQGTLDRQLVMPLALLNIPGVNPKRLPCFKLDIGEGEDIAAYADALPKLAGVGLQIPVKWAHDKLRIPLAEDGEAVLTAAPAPAAPGAADPNAPADDAPGQADPPNPPAAPGAKLRMAGKPAPKPAAPGAKAPLAAKLPAGGPRDAMDAVVDSVLADWQPLLAPLIEPLMAELERAAAAGESIAQFRARLPAIAERMDASAMTESLARASFVARLAGEADLTVNPEEQP